FPLCQELVSSNPNQRNWRGILIALLVIVIVLALIVTSVVLLTPPDDGPRVKGHRFKLQDILGHEFTPLRFNGSWVSGDELVFRDQWGGISLLNAANLTTRSLMTNQTFKRFNPARFVMSPDHRFILLAHNIQKLFRHSYLAQYSVYDIATMDIFPLTPTPKEEGHPFLLHADWAPRGHSLVMVYNYDIYYLLSPRGGQAYRVTKTAVPGIISNGVTDWLYEEEVLSSNQALWMSDDGHLMLYATFNDTLVEEQRFPWFAVQDEGKLYPEIRSLRYPKPGTPNPLVSLWVADLADPKNIGTRDLKPPVAFQKTKYYLGIPEGRPGQLHLYRTSAASPKVGVPLSAPQCLTCQPEHSSPPPYSPYASMAGARSGTGSEDESDEWKEDGDETTPTTTLSPLRKTRGTQKQRWDVMDILVQPCQYHNVVFSPGLLYYALECLGPGVPTVQLYATRGTTPKLLATLQNNTQLIEKASKMALPQVKTFPVQISGGYTAQVRLHLPPGLREEEITRYPLVVHVYGSPGSQIVTERWKLDWSTYLAGNRDFIVAQIDGRGSGGQGYQMLHEVYMRLGTVEVADQLEVTEYLRDSLHFVDKRRVAVWGWSYGGFMAAMALAREQNVFHCGISVAPVTTWRLYDSAYTERYMGLPNVTGNYKGYEEADVNLQVDHLRDKMFYLVHGTADDNVHFQQSMTLAKNLASKGVLFRQQVYPDESHSLNGVMRHLYRSMANFLDDCFRKQVPPDLKAGLRNGGTFGE
ncbi:hypothetical protein Cfor_02278, partial [Coptotermes formosanus]